MVVLRCTRRLLDRIPESPSANGARSTTRLGDWYATLVVLRPVQIVVAVSERTLLPVVLRAAPFAGLAVRFAPAVAETLGALGVAQGLVDEEVQRMADLVLGRTLNRQVLGSLNDFVRMLPYELEATGSHLDASLGLAKAPCGPIGMEAPEAATRRAFGG